MSEEKLVAPGSTEYWERRCHEAWADGDQDAYRINELRDALYKAAQFLDVAARRQCPSEMQEFRELAAEIREVLVPPGVKALRAAPAEPAAPEHVTESDDGGNEK